MEAVNLISSPKYSEKQIVCCFNHGLTWANIFTGLPCCNFAYAWEFRFPAACSQFYPKGSRRKQRDRQLSCFTRHCKCWWKRNGGGVSWGRSSPSHFSVRFFVEIAALSIIHPSDRTSQTFVKKKAALTLLRLYRKHPDVIPASEWALRIVSIMDDPDLVNNVCLSGGDKTLTFS